MVSKVFDLIRQKIVQDGLDKKYVISCIPDTVLSVMERSDEDLPVPIIVLDRNSKYYYKKGENLKPFQRLLEEDITSFRTESTGKSGFLLFVSPDISYQDSLNTTTIKVDDLYSQVALEILGECALTGEQIEVINAGLVEWGKQVFDPRTKVLEGQWELLRQLDDCIGLADPYSHIISKIGLFSGTNISNLRKSLDLMKDLARLINENGLYKALNLVQDRINDENLDSKLTGYVDIMYHYLRERVGDGVGFVNIPMTAISCDADDWWVHLNIDFWTKVFSIDNKHIDFSIKFCNESYLHRSKLYLVGDNAIKLKTDPNVLVNWKINRKNSVLSSNELEIEIEDLDLGQIYQTVSATDINGNRKSIKFLHFPTSTFPVLIDCLTAESISAVKGHKGKHYFECDILFPAMGSHKLKLYYAKTWQLVPQVVAFDHSSSEESENIPINSVQSIILGGVEFNQAAFEVFADESCRYEIVFLSDKGEVKKFIIRATSEDGDARYATSFYESLLLKNLSRKVNPRVVVPKGITGLERTLILNKKVTFNPIIIASDFNETNYSDASCLSQEYTILSSNLKFDFEYDYRSKNLDKVSDFGKLVELRSEIIEILFPPNEPSQLCVECLDLSAQISRSPRLKTAVEEYLSEYLALISNPEFSDDIKWFDVVCLYWNDTSTISSEPVAVFLNPFHPITLGWQIEAQSILSEAIDSSFPCPIAGKFTPNKTPSTWALKLGRSNFVEFIAVSTNLDYWRAYWNVKELRKIGNPEFRDFFKQLGVSIENSAVSLSQEQVYSSLKQIYFLQPALNELRVGVVGSDSFNGFNRGVEQWISSLYTSEEDNRPYKVWSSLNSGSLRIFDFRDKFCLPSNDFLNDIVNEKGIDLEWYSVNMNSEQVNLGVIARMEIGNSIFENSEVCVESILLFGGLFKIEFSSNKGNSIVECKSSIVDSKSSLLEKIIVQCEREVFSKTGKNSLKYNPGLEALDSFIDNSNYTVVSSAGLDLSYILNFAKGKFKLWDFELPRYGKSLSSHDGYYMVSVHSEFHNRVIQEAVRNVTCFSIDANLARKVTDWMNSVGILSLKNLAAGGGNATGDIGVLVTHLILQPGKYFSDDFEGLFAVNSREKLFLIVPVDPFQDRIEMIKDFMEIQDRTRPDLVGVCFNKLVLGEVSIFPIEVKTRTGSFTTVEMESACKQILSFGTFIESIEAFAGKNKLWASCLPVFLSELIKYSMGIQLSLGALSKGDVEFMRDSLGNFISEKRKLLIENGWLFVLSESNNSDTFQYKNEVNVVSIKRQDAKHLIEGSWTGFMAACKRDIFGRILGLNSPGLAQKERQVSSVDEVNQPVPQLDSRQNIVDLKKENIVKWEVQYQDLLSILMEHDVSVSQVEEYPFVEGPAFITYHIKPGRGVRVREVENLHDELKLGLRLSEDQRILFRIDDGILKVEIPKKQSDRYYIDTRSLWIKVGPFSDTLQAPLGEDQEGEVVLINFSDHNSAHLLIGGSTGSGKSEALNTILHGLCHFKSNEELKLLLIDPKGTEMVDFEDSSHLLDKIGIFADDAIKYLELAVSEMESRYQLFREIRVNNLVSFNKTTSLKKLPWWLIVLDEYGDLTSSAEDKKRIEGLLKRLAQKARAAGIHIIVTTQKPSAEVISTNIRSNLGAQLALKVRGSAESKVILDRSGAEALNGKGDALFFDGSKSHRIQVGLLRR